MCIHNSKAAPSSATHPYFSSAHSTVQQLTLSHFLTSHASKSSPQKLHQTDAEIGDHGKLHVKVRKSNASRRSLSAMTPRPSNLTGAEIYSLSSSRNPTPRGSNFNPFDFYSMMGVQGFNTRHSNFRPADLYSVQSSCGPTPQPHPQPNTAPSSEMQWRRMPNLALSWFFCLSGCHFKVRRM
ncbi:hypothetical protein ACFX1T_012865 [Malus domestica]